MKGNSAPKIESTRRDPITVLIAESDEAARTLFVESVLFFTNHRVVEASTGPDAVERVRRHRPQVAVLSMTLTDFEGLSAVRALKRDPATRETKIVVILRSEDPHERALAVDAGADELIVMPALAGELIEAVKRALTPIVVTPRPPSVRRVQAAVEEPRSRSLRAPVNEPVNEPEP
jgi:CheY-like chemotaxis protein